MSQPSDHPHGQQVVHVRGDSESDLEDLFKVLTYKEPTQVPLKDRNLPASFFRPPEPRLNPNHSREGSTDFSNFNPNPTATHTGLPISHGRSHSSPAGLPHTLTAPPSILQPHHAKTQSFDLAEDANPLPPGWEMAKTPSGQAYFLNHLEQITTWVDPRKSLSTTALNQQSSPAANQGQLPPQSQLSPNLSLHNVATLPINWEQATTPEGEIYFINHIDRSTSWFDPRIPKQLQKPGMKMNQLQQIQQQAGLGSPGSPSPPMIPPPACPDLSPQSHLQGGLGTPESQFRQQLRRLQQEKELLRKRQEEISRQVCLNEMLLSEMVTQPTTPQGSDMQSVTTSGVDPFLGQGGTTVEPQHPRQNSADSGLGGMGTNYSLPRTPEDFLSTNGIDEMDNQDGGHKMQTQQNTLESMQVTATNMDIGGDVNDNTTAMDSDDLVPSLQEDISSELLTDADVQSVLNTNKMENLLTWL